MRAWFVILCGCNQTFGLDSTKLVDSALPVTTSCQDSEIEFSPRLRLHLIQKCIDFSTAESSDRTLATCTFGGVPVLAEGSNTKPLEPAVVKGQTGVLSRPHLSPEGDRAVIEQARPTPSLFSVFRREADGWYWDHDLPLPTDFDDTVGIPSRAPFAHILHARPNQGRVDEYVEDPPRTWTLVASYTPQELGTLSTYKPFSMSADGLHLVYSGHTFDGFEQYHATRTNISERFAGFRTLVGVPKEVIDPFVNADCSRIYFSGLERVFYVARE